ncbi:MAG: hypothetical protein ACXV8O_01595 [Methylobacter sp.]
MQNKVQMVDHKKHRFSKSSWFIPWLIIGLMFLIGIASMLANSVKADPVQCSVTEAVEDNLMSPERAEFMVLFEHGEEITEFDMD